MPTKIKRWKGGFELNWCNYTRVVAIENSRKLLRGGNNDKARKIICLNNGEIFDAIIIAKEKYKATNIGQCYQGNRRYSGKIDEELLQWQYYDEWMVSPKKLLTEDIVKQSYLIKGKKARKIINLNTLEVFASESKAREKYKGAIYQCCQGKRETADGCHWEYYDDNKEYKKE